MGRLRKHLRPFALLAYATVLLSGLSGHDLCIGADGHVALELSNWCCCGDCADYGAHPAPGARWVGASGACGDCLDIPLSFGADDHHAPHGGRVSRGTAAVAAPSTGATPVPPTAALQPVTAFDLFPPPARSVPTIALRSVVLRI